MVAPERTCRGEEAISSNACVLLQLDSQKDPAHIASLGLLEFVADLGKETNSDTTVSLNQQLPSRGMEAGPFILREALPVVPARLVKKILKGEYVDMAELLKDNMEVEMRLQESEMGHATRVATRREIPDLLSWLHYYSLYAAIICSQYPEKAQIVGLSSQPYRRGKEVWWAGLVPL